MDRRTFMKTSSTLAATSAIAPRSLTGRFKQTNGLITGHGSHRYKVDQEWHKDLSIPVKDCHEMVQAPDGRLFMLTNHTKNNVLIYDKSGKVLSSWGSEYPGAHGLTLSTEGSESFVWITDEKTGAVNKHSLDGRNVLSLKYPYDSGYYADISEYKPTETTVAPDGSIFVADGYGKNYIHHYDSKGEYLSSFGGSGTGPAHLDCAHGVTIDIRTPTPTLLVTSRSKQCFKRYSLDGKLLDTYQTPGLWICRPVIKGDFTYFSVIVSQTWYGYDGMIAIFDKDMKLVSVPGSSDEEISYSGGLLKTPISDEMTFMNPHDVCVDNEENLYVPQWYSGRTYPMKLTRV